MVHGLERDNAFAAGAHGLVCKMAGTTHSPQRRAFPCSPRPMDLSGARQWEGPSPPTLPTWLLRISPEAAPDVCARKPAQIYQSPARRESILYIPGRPAPGFRGPGEGFSGCERVAPVSHQTRGCYQTMEGVRCPPGKKKVRPGLNTQRNTTHTKYVMKRFSKKRHTERAFVSHPGSSCVC